MAGAQQSLKRPGGGLGAWLELSRLSNAPTVISGAFTGVVLGMITTEAAAVRWPAFMNASISCVFMYAGGMILNDAIDAYVDAVERPGRPIPSGRVPRAHAFAAGIAALVAGVGMVATSGAPAIALAVVLAMAVILYDLAHAHAAASVVLLGACRGLVYLVGYSAATHMDPWMARSVCLLAAGAAAYTAVFSLIARREMGVRPAWTAVVAWLVPLGVLGAIALVQPAPRAGPIVLAAVLLGWQVWAASLWTRTPPRPVHAVMAWIAGFCLIDAVVVAASADWTLIAVPLGSFVVTVLLQRRILGS